MGFMAAYKRLEKLCGEIMNDEKRVNAYINEMSNTIDGVYHVCGWNDDLKQLKHYLWVRNQIAHNPDCTEENMCEPRDEQWLDDFYSRIMNQTDPLSLYRRAKTPNKVKASTQPQITQRVTPNIAPKVTPNVAPQPCKQQKKKTFLYDVACAFFILVAVSAIASLIILFLLK